MAIARRPGGAPVDGLYRVPLDRFVEERNALAKKLAGAGRDERAAEVRSLQKPGLPAWAVNQVYWQHRKHLDRLLRAGDRVRTVQHRGGGAGALQAAARRRREALIDLLSIAERLLEDAGHGTARSTLRRVESTLEALAAGTDPAEAGGLGRLTGELQPPGFEALLSLAGSAVPPRRQSDPPRADPRKARRRQHAKEAVAEAERELARARKELERAEKARARADALAQRAAAAIELAQDRLQAADLDGRRAVSAQAKAEQQRREARKTIERAEGELAQSRRTVADLLSAN